MDPMQIVVNKYTNLLGKGETEEEALEAAINAYLLQFPGASRVDAKFAVHELLEDLER